MRLVLTALMVLLTGTAVAAPAVSEPDPVLIEQSVSDNVPPQVLVPAAWAAAAAGAGAAAFLASWAVSAAPSPASFTAFAWATAALALAAAALEYLFTVPPDPPTPN